MGSGHIFTLLLFLTMLSEQQGFYVPGVAPVEFREGDAIEVKAIKVTSMKTVVPYEYYSLPFCKPQGPLLYNSENLGEVMRGDRIVNTPFEVHMRRDVSCKSTCANHVLSVNSEQSEVLARRIKEEYHVHLLIDNLPCFTVVNNYTHEHGYRLGWQQGSSSFVNNHLHIILSYHQPAPHLYRVVGFEVQPSSIHSTSQSEQTCSLSEQGEHEEVKQGQNDIAWTYSVHWKESAVPWASRWDTYLSMKDVQIHWFSILNSIIVVLCLAGFLSVIIVRTVRRDIAQYNLDEDADESLEETGWKLVHGDILRAPSQCMWLVSVVGTGIQLAAMVFITVFFAMLGMLSPASRGSLASAAVLFYCLMGLVAGYHAGRLYKTFKGNNPMRCALQLGLFFPTVVLGTGFVLNLFLIGKHSSGAVPFTTMLALLLLWFGVDIPLILLGFHFGFRKQMYSHPVRTNQIPRQVPEQAWYLHTLPCMLFAGILPFGAVFIELFFIFSALWENQFYYLFGFLFLVCVILYVSCALISILVTYFLLIAENYHWWWKSFSISGGSAIYVMAYGTFYFFTKLNIVGFIPTLLYFSYTFLMALTFWLVTGTIGFYAAYYFVCVIYAAVKID